MISLEKLEKIAKYADAHTNVEWFSEKNLYAFEGEDAKYMAAFDPKTALKLIQALKIARQCLKQVNKQADDTENGIQTCNNTCHALTEIDALIGGGNGS